VGAAERHGLARAGGVMIVTPQHKVQATARLVSRVVAEQYRVAAVDIASQRRTRVVCEARWVAIVIAGRLTGVGGYRLGSAFNLDPTTILYARRKIAAMVGDNLAVAGLLPTLQARCERTLACAALERPAHDQRGRNERVLTELCRRLNTDWAGTITQLEHLLFEEARDAA